MAGATALPLQQFIAALDNTGLPKILQVCSGVYFQGSVYEISGSEVCFSTGDLIKVIGTELLSVCCEDISNNEKFELPINHTGLFEVVPEEMSLCTVEEMVSGGGDGESRLPFTSTRSSKGTRDNFTLEAGSTLTVLSFEQHEGEEDKVRCQVQGQQGAPVEVLIPLTALGDFSKGERKECFTLGEIMSSPLLHSRRFRSVNIAKSESQLVLTPIYQVHAVMNLRKHILTFPSSLEMDVVDVTEQCKDVNFVTPLSLTEVSSQPPESFPTAVNILEGPEPSSALKCSWLPELSQSRRLVFHKVGTTAMILLSSLKSRKAQQYFLVSQQYGGRFRRRPREFNSVYELYVASIHAPGLKVSVTRNSEEVEEEGLPALSVGEQLEVVHCKTMELPTDKGQKQSVEALLCQRLQEPDDGDDDDDDEEEAKQGDGREEIFLPLYMQGHFVEVLTDNKKYRLTDLGKDFSLPLDVKVASRDTELETDPLPGFACLRIHGAMLEPTILASFRNRPDHCFEIPTQWISMSVSFADDPLPWPTGQPTARHVNTVTEVTETFFYEFCKRENSGAAPPPRPPKQNLPSSKACQRSSSKPSKKLSKADKSKHRPEKSTPTKEFANLTLNSKRRPPAPPPPVILDDQAPPVIPRKQTAAEEITCNALPNTYVKMEGSKKKGHSYPKGIQSRSTGRVEKFPEDVSPLIQEASSFLIVLLNDVAADVDSDHDYETVDDTLVTMVKKAQENVIYY